MILEDFSRWDQATRRYPNAPRAYVRRGMAQFKLGNIAESIADFDRAEQLDATITPYLWQRGLSYYYADRFEEGVKQFEIDLTVNANDIEETIWRYLCLARGRGAAQASLLDVKNDPRLVMRSVYNLFAGACTVDTVFSIGAQEGNRGRFYSFLYVGLYYEAIGKEAEARSAIGKAVKEFRSRYRTEDYMGYLAIVHQQVRGWL
ncbi:hypothetical protein IFO70_08220 [Phormidium tenue FACHB-886]|nr:hypothetical protein [Phormidium tenue FACHB-886]